jgi:hypothetical protein
MSLQNVDDKIEVRCGAAGRLRHSPRFARTTNEPLLVSAPGAFGIARPGCKTSIGEMLPASTPSNGLPALEGVMSLS